MKRGRSTGKPTKAEAARIVAAKEGPCVACYVHARNGGMWEDQIIYGCDYNHCKSGNIRRGHMFGYALCKYHHQNHPIEPLSFRATAAKYGPSLMSGSRLFHETYGSDDELIELQTKLIS